MWDKILDFLGIKVDKKEEVKDEIVLDAKSIFRKANEVKKREMKEKIDAYVEYLEKCRSRMDSKIVKASSKGNYSIWEEVELLNNDRPFSEQYIEEVIFERYLANGFSVHSYVMHSGGIKFLKVEVSWRGDE